MRFILEGGLDNFHEMLGAVEKKQWGRAAIEIHHSKLYTDIGKRGERFERMMERGELE